MDSQQSNINFGMAFVSPSKSNMHYFKKYLSAKNNGKIDTKALGEFIIEQAKNKKVDLTFKHTKNGDILEVYNYAKPEQKQIISCTNTNTNTNTNTIKNNNFLDKIKNYFKEKTEKFEYDPVGSWDNLPIELKQAGELANKMEKEIG